MKGLGELFDEAEGQAARAAGDAQLGEDRLGAVHTTVRRAHARRSALQASLAAVAVVVLGAGVAYGFWRTEEPPALDVPLSPSPSSTPSATPSASPSEPATAFPAFAGTVTEHAHLPAASAITPEVWATVAPGWSLVSYQERWFDGDSAEGRGPQVIYVVSPDGERYELTAPDGDSVGVLAWDAGATTAVVSVQPDGEPPYMGVLDLVRGEVTRVGDYAPYVWSLAELAPNGEPVWMGNDATFTYLTVAPDGAVADFGDQDVVPGNAAEVAYFALQFPGIDCGVAAPFDSESSIVICWDNRFSIAPSDIDPAEAHFAVARVWPADDRVEVLLDTTYAQGTASSPTRAGDYVVARTGQVGLDGCPTAFSKLDGGEPEPLPGWVKALHPNDTVFMPFGATGNTLVWGATSGCDGADVTPIAVVRTDLERGTGTVLVPYPYDRPAGEEPLQSVTGVAVGR